MRQGPNVAVLRGLGYVAALRGPGRLVTAAIRPLILPAGRAVDRPYGGCHRGAWCSVIAVSMAVAARSQAVSSIMSCPAGSAWAVVW